MYDARSMIKILEEEITKTQERMTRTDESNRLYYEGRYDLATALRLNIIESNLTHSTALPPSTSFVGDGIVTHRIATTADSEIDAMLLCKMALEGLDSDEQNRVLAWLNKMRKQKKYE